MRAHRDPSAHAVSQVAASVWALRVDAGTDRGAKLGDFDSWIRLIADGSLEQQVEAAEHLGESGAVEAIDVLVEALAVDDDVNSTTAFMDAKLGFIAHYSWGLGHAAFRALCDIGLPAIPALVGALSESDQSARIRAAGALAHLGQHGGVLVLLSAMVDSDEGVRAFAAEHIGRLFDYRVYTVLRNALDDQSDEVRAEAIRSFGTLGNDAALELLLGVLDDDEATIRSSAAEALGKVGDACAVEPLILALDDDCADVRFSAAGSLGILRDLRAGEPLLATLSDEDPYVRLQVIGALGGLAYAPAVDPLIEIVQGQRRWGDERGVEPNWAAYALGEIGDLRAVEPLVAALDGDEDIDREVAEALADLGDQRAVEPLAALARKYAFEYITWFSQNDSPDELMAISGALEALGGRGTVRWSTAATAGSDPYPEEKLDNVLREWGVCDLRYLTDAEAVVVILGRSGWSPSRLDDLVKLHSGGELRVYSQEMALYAIAMGKDLFEECELDELLDMGKGHPALEYLIGLGFDWPSARPLSGPSALVVSFGLDGAPAVGVLALMGYHVGYTGLGQSERRDILKALFESAKLARGEGADRDGYIAQWGEPRSAKRLEKMAKTLRGLTDLDRRKTMSDMSRAIEHREEDLAWLKATYYDSRSRSRFRWPETRVH